MRVSLNFLVRIAGMIAFATFGRWIGVSLSGISVDGMEQVATQLLMLAGAGLGLLTTPQFTIEPVRELLRRARVVPLSDILIVAAGGLFGLVGSALLTVPISVLPGSLGQFLPLVVTATLAYVGAMIALVRRRDILNGLKVVARSQRTTPDQAATGTPEIASDRRYLLDTSAIIDGRIAAVARTGFLDGKLLVPTFVLTELQDLADSSDDLRRNKGRRGLELVREMQKTSPLPVEVTHAEVNGATRVDDRLVILAREFNCPIITNDFNLNRVAGIQGLRVLSLNQLSDAVRPAIAQDQRLQVQIRNEGNVRQQGVGYLNDGTPVFVEDARDMIGRTIEVVVTRLLQTQSGRMVFATISDHNDEKAS